MSASRKTKRRYGDTYVEGNASVHLGDCYTGKLDEYHIETAYFLMRERLDLFRSKTIRQSAKPSQRVFNDRDNPRRHAPERRHNVALHSKKRQVPLKSGSDASDEESSPESTRVARKRISSQLTIHQLAMDTNPARELFRQKRDNHAGAKRSLLEIYSKLKPTLMHPFAASIIISVLALQLQQVLIDPLDVEYEINHILTKSMLPPLQQLASLCAFSASCLIYRNTVKRHSQKLTARYRQERTLPLMASLFRLGMDYYVQSSSLPRGPPLGDHTNFVDAFGCKRKLPLSVCQDALVLKLFLEAHYQGTPAETLVRNGSYSMLYGSRNGLAIRDSDWSKRFRITRNMCVVMAVSIKVEDGACPNCRSALVMLKDCDLFCDACDRRFRNHMAVRHIGEHCYRAQAQYGSAIQLAKNTSLLSNNTTKASTPGIGSLKYVDIQLVQERSHVSSPLDIRLQRAPSLGMSLQTHQSAVSLGANQSNVRTFRQEAGSHLYLDPVTGLSKVSKIVYPTCSLEVTQADHQVLQNLPLRAINRTSYCKSELHDEHSRNKFNAQLMYRAPYNIMLLGATGSIGTYVTRAMVDANSQGHFGHISIYTSEATIVKKVQDLCALEAWGVEIFVGTLDDKVRFQRACRGVDTIVSCIGPAVISKQIPIITWAEEVGVTRFLPSEYGLDDGNFTGYLPELHQLKSEVRRHLHRCRRIEHTHFVTGPICQSYFQAVKDMPEAGGFDFEKSTAYMLGDGNMPIKFTAANDLGTLVVAALINYDASRNQKLIVHSFTATQNEILAEHERQTRQKWQTVYTDLETIESVQRDAYSKHPHLATKLTLGLITSDGDISHSCNGNCLLGITETETLEDQVNLNIATQSGRVPSGYKL